MKTVTAERRAYFRIKDEIALSYSVIKDGEDDPHDALGDVELSLLSMLANVDQELNEVINILWRENSTAAQALGLLNRKVSMVAAHVLQDEDCPGKGYEELTASISGCGMAFESADPVAVDTRLKVSAILRPSNIRVQFTALVVACERLSDIPASSYLLRIGIDEDCSDAREQLVQHVVQRQFSSRDRSGSAA